jgi:hypothetical protein
MCTRDFRHDVDYEWTAWNEGKKKQVYLFRDTSLLSTEGNVKKEKKNLQPNGVTLAKILTWNKRETGSAISIRLLRRYL